MVKIIMINRWLIIHEYTDIEKMINKLNKLEKDT